MNTIAVRANVLCLHLCDINGQSYFLSLLAYHLLFPVLTSFLSPLHAADCLIIT